MPKNVKSVADTTPKDKTLTEPIKVRVFKQDKPVMEQLSTDSGIDQVELTRRALHVGLPILAELFGVELKPTSKAA